jgi:hypothetical protein
LARDEYDPNAGAPVAARTTTEPERQDLQVAFAGHNRPHDLGSRDEIRGQLGAAFELLRTAGVRRARLVTGLATGADELAAEAWRDAGLGPIHGVLPYLDFQPAGGIGPGGIADSATWLDGAAAEAAGRNAHLKQTRMIVEAADLVVVVWTGGPARGAGGTADAVLCALQLGLPVLWLQPSAPDTPRLIRPENLAPDFHFPEFQEALHHGRLDRVQDASPELLRELLGEPRERPALPAPRRLGPVRSALDRFMHASLWRTYPFFRNIVAGRAAPYEAPPPPPASLEAQTGFRLLSRAYAASDHVANRLSAIHRSEQMLLILGMILAALVGSAWTIWPEMKLTGVFVELTLSLIGLFVWAAAADAHQHERWSEHRFVAERLRLERAAWALCIGLDLGGRRADAEAAQGWRHVRRDAGLPHGGFDPERAAAWGGWAMGELIQGQAAYHRAVSTRDDRFAHRIHRFESLSFMWFFAIFTFYISSYLGGFGHGLPHWFAGMVAMTGAVVPALAAAAMAMESKLELQEQSERSRRIASTLEDLAARLRQDASFESMQNLGREAVRLHLAESGHWQENVNRRRLFRA